MKIASPSSAAVKLFGTLLPKDPQVTNRPVFGNPAGFANGNMFFGVYGDALYVRLSDSDRADLLRHPDARVFEPMRGRPMREYVELPDAILGDWKEAGRWIGKSLAYAAGLPPKKGKAKAAKKSPRKTKRS